MTEDFANRVVEDQVGGAVHVGARLVDEDQFMAAVVTDQAGSGVDDEARAADDEHVGVADVVQGLFDDVVVQAFFIEDDVGLDGAAAGVALGDACGILHVFGVEEFVAVHAEVAVDAAVQFQDILTARFLVQAVDVLGDDGFQFAGFFQFGQLDVGHVGLGVEGQHLVAVETVEFFRVVHEEGVAEDRFGRVFIVLVVQAVSAAEIGDAAFRRYAGAAEEDDVIRIFYHVDEFFNICHRNYPFHTLYVSFNNCRPDGVRNTLSRKVAMASGFSWSS